MRRERPLPAKAAIGRNHEALRRDVLQGFAYKAGDHLGRLDYRVGMANPPMAIFLSVGCLPRSGRSRPPVLAHSRVSTSVFISSMYGSAFS